MARTKAGAANDWLSEMRRSFDSAQYSSAARLYDESVARGSIPENEAVLLRARAYLRLDSKRVVQFLLKHDLRRPTKIQEGRRAMYLGTGYSRIGDFAEADRAFQKAATVLSEGSSRAELAAHISRRYLEQRDLFAAEEWQKKTLSDRTLAGRIRSEHLASYIWARRERYRDQAACVINVLNLIEDRRAQFVEEWCVAVHTLAALARELPIAEAEARAKLEVDRDMDWPEDQRIGHFQALKAVAWCQALAGDELSCLRYLRRAQLLDTGPAWKAILYLDRSFFASIVGENTWAANEFSAAEDVAEEIVWDDTTGEERVALLLLAELATIHAPKRARFYIARFNDLGKMRTRIHHFAFDDRLHAMAAYTSGLVSLAAGDAIAAQDALRDAWGTFDRIGYDVRAAKAALGLYQATEKPRWLHLAEDKLERYPRSWLTRRLSGVATPAEPSIDLPKMQRAVTQLVSRGLSTPEIAAELGVSRHTVFNHLKAVYRKLGVNSRNALVAEALKRKIV